MMRAFQFGDLENFEANEFSDASPEALGEVASDEWVKFSLVDTAVMCVAFVKHLGNCEWKGFFLISKQFRARHAVELRNFMRRGCAAYAPKKLWTVSRRNEIIAEWHRFMGLTRGEPMVVNGIQCDVWSMGEI